MIEQVVLTDERDREIGVMEKLSAHRKGLLHRAFSVFVFNPEGELMLQKRAAAKYHSGGLWSNTACGHPRPGESVHAAARRRLKEEMGFDCLLSAAFSFIYRAELANRIAEYEYDHVLTGNYSGSPSPDASEVEDWRWVRAGELLGDLAAHPDSYTYWFKAAISLMSKNELLGGRWR